METPDALKRPVHGGLNYTELESLGLRADEVIDFSASINPLGPSQRVREATSRINMASYPDPECLELRGALGYALGVDPRNILPGNGSTELIHLLTRALLTPERPAVIFAPTFGEYTAACNTEGVEAVTLAPTTSQMASGQFRWDMSAAIERISEICPALVFLCNPNNPTGVYLREDEIRRVTEALQGVGILVLDEAYVPFVEESWPSTPLMSLGNVVLLRSMTKDHALTGLRLGYMLAAEDIIARVRRFQYSWSVNSLAQAAGIAALSDTEHLEKGREVVNAGKNFLAGTARELGLAYSSGAANFMLLKVGRAQEVRLAMLKHHRICVRDCSSFGLPEYIRVGIRTADDNRKLAEALGHVMVERGAVA